MRKLSIAILSLSLLFPAFTSAATFRSGDSVTLQAPVSDDLYVVSGGVASINRDITGDLFIAAERVEIENSVSQSIHAAAGEVRIMSTVGNDVLVAGGTVEVHGTIQGDLIVFGGIVVVGNDAVVLGDVVVNGGKMVLRGPVGHNLLVSGGKVVMEGIFHGNIDVRAESLTVNGPVEGNARIEANELHILPNAAFRGSVDYWTQNQPTDFGSSLAQGQKATYHPEYAHETKRMRPGMFASFLGAISLVSLLSGALILLLLLFATKSYFVDAAKILRRKPWWSLLWGFLFFAATPIAMLLLAITVIGLPLALLLLSSYLLILLFAAPVTAMLAARWLQLTLKKNWNFWALFGVSFVALLILKLLSFVPVIGWAIKVVVILFAVGALIETKVLKWKKIR